MKHRGKKLLLSMVVMCVGGSYPLEASIIQGKRVYTKYLKKPCGFKGDLMGQKYTQEEWKYFFVSNSLSDVMLQVCPDSKRISKPKDLKNLYHFLSNFASDSGNVPSCN